MQVILLAAGQSSRMHPLNDSHKSMIKLLGKPLISYTIEKLKNQNLKDIVIITSPKSDVQDYFGDGSKLGVSIKYIIQEKPEGAGNALLLVKKYINNNFLLINSHHVEIDEFLEEILSVKSEKTDGLLLVKKRENVADYGVVRIAGKKVVGIVEKPKKGEEPSNLCIVGVYLLPVSFLEILQNTPSEHYQFEKALDIYSKEYALHYVETEKETLALKYPWDLFSIKDYLLQNIKNYRGKNAEISDTATIEGVVWIGDGAKIMDRATIKGPAYIGSGAVVGSYSLVRKNTIIEDNAHLGSYMEIANSILMDNATTHSGFIGDSIIGSGTKIGAQFCTGNARLDRETVKAVVKEDKVDTNLKHFGSVVGKNTRIGIKSVTMPGVIIGSNVTIGPSTTVLRNVSNGTKYYTKFQEVINE